MRLLFVKESLVWPRVSGHHVHTYYLLRGLGQLGHTLGLLTNLKVEPKALEGLALNGQYVFDQVPVASSLLTTRLTRSQEFFHARWGISKRFSAAVRQVADDFHPDAVVVVGWKEAAYLSMLSGLVRVWYPADDPIRYNLAQARRGRFFHHVRLALSYSLFERAFRSRIDRVWVVAAAERFWPRWLGGQSAVDVIPNGVDAEFYQPGPEPVLARSCVFWGRLDFAPNVQALQWFCAHVWPTVRDAAPDARFSIYGFNPTPAVASLTGKNGIEMVANLPDLRAEIARHQVVALPFLSKGGIKNKLLEAASMGKAIICSPQAAAGLSSADPLPVWKARHPQQWVRALTQLWSDQEERVRLGRAARAWVTAHHDWRMTARLAAASIEGALSK